MVNLKMMPGRKVIVLVKEGTKVVLTALWLVH